MYFPMIQPFLFSMNWNPGEFLSPRLEIPGITDLWTVMSIIIIVTLWWTNIAMENGHL